MMKDKKLKTSYRYILKRVRIFFATHRNREFLTFFFFIALSSLFWILQSMNEETEKIYKIPLVYQNIPNNIVISDSVPKEIKVRIKDKGLILLRYSLNKRFVPIDIDFNMLNGSRDGTYIINEASLISSIKKQLKLTSSILSINPQQIRLIFNLRKNKKVPVVLKGDVIPKMQTRIADSGIKILPDSVEIFATEDIIDSTTVVFTESISLEDIGETISKEINIENINGLKVIPSKVTVNVPIEEYTEKSLSLPINIENAPDSINVRVFPSNVDVSFFVGLSDFKTAVRDSFKVIITYTDILESKSQKVPVILSKSPKHISNVRINPDSLEYLLEIK